VNDDSRARVLESNSGVRARVPLSQARSAHATLALALLLTSCRAFGPAPPELVELLPVASPLLAGPLNQHSLHVAIESEALSGEFEAVAATSAQPNAGVRLQMFGDLGGKLFDMAALPTRFTGYFPHAEIGIEFGPESSKHPRHLISFMAASLLEASTPITIERVLAARADDSGGWELELDPVMQGIRVSAKLTREGALVERGYELSGVRWTERIGSERVFRGGGFELTLTNEETASLDSIPEGAFELSLPEGFHP